MKVEEQFAERAQNHIELTRRFPPGKLLTQMRGGKEINVGYVAGWDLEAGKVRSTTGKLLHPNDLK